MEYNKQQKHKVRKLASEVNELNQEVDKIETPVAKPVLNTNFIEKGYYKETDWYGENATNQHLVISISANGTMKVDVNYSPPSGYSAYVIYLKMLIKIKRELIPYLKINTIYKTTNFFTSGFEEFNSNNESGIQGSDDPKWAGWSNREEYSPIIIELDTDYFFYYKLFHIPQFVYKSCYSVYKSKFIITVDNRVTFGGNETVTI